jgi:RNA polymerase sigma-70 factor, ECF subfamily
VGIFSLIVSRRSRHQVDEVRRTLSPPAGVPPADRLRSASTEERDHAWRALYDAEFSRVYRLACRFGVPAAEVEDVTQQVFVVAHRRIAEMEEVSNLRAWLRGIAVKVVADHHRWRRVRRIKAWLVEALYLEADAGRTTPAREAEQAELRERIAEVLRTLSPKLRSVLVLADIEECSLAEVAEAVGAPVNTVRSRRRLAREAFQREWERLTGASGDGGGEP